jgi:hypothetical protein
MRVFLSIKTFVDKSIGKLVMSLIAKIKLPKNSRDNNTQETFNESKSFSKEDV